MHALLVQTTSMQDLCYYEMCFSWSDLSVSTRCLISFYWVSLWFPWSGCSKQHHRWKHLSEGIVKSTWILITLHLPVFKLAFFCRGKLTAWAFIDFERLPLLSLCRLDHIVVALCYIRCTWFCIKRKIHLSFERLKVNNKSQNQTDSNSLVEIFYQWDNVGRAFKYKSNY